MRGLGALAAAAWCVGIGLTAVHAQGYPDRPIKVVVPYVPGSPPDVLARVVTQQASARLPQSMIVENRPGAGTTLGMKAVAAAAPDGYTLLLSGQGLAYMRMLYPDLGFEPSKAFVPVATLATWSHVLVVAPSVPVKTVQELVAYAKANPGKLTFGFGLGTVPQILGEYFKAVAAIDIASIPYRGGEQVRVDLLGGRIAMNIGPISNVLGLIQQGKVRPLAVTYPTRHPVLPDLPTMRESGYPQVGFDPDVWQGFFAPAGTPETVINKLNAELNESIASPAAKAAFERLGFESKITSPQEHAAFIASELKKWPPIIEASGVKPQ